jgi:putative redox protein
MVFHNADLSTLILTKFVNKGIKKLKNMKDVINVKWIGNMAFETDINDHKILLDASPEVGGKNKGPRPKPLLMVSLAGCTAMDVISILKKMKVEVIDFNVKVEAILSDEHPKRFTDLHLVYEFTGNNLPLEKIKHAIMLSQDKYCGITASLRNTINLTYEIKINQL